MRRSVPLAAILAAALLAGCGASGAKRTVDARVEALRFFASETPLVALVGTSAETGISDPAIASLDSLPPWDALWEETRRRLRRAGISPARLDALVRGSEAVEGLPASQLAVELSRPDASLTVLVTDASEGMDELFERAAKRARLTRAGELDDATIYTTRDGALAVRDGVMLAAATTARVREAIMTRDGDRGDQLDDRDVQELLDEIPERVPLDVYANVGELTDSDAAITELASPPAIWLRSVREAVFAVRGTPQGLLIDAFGRLDEDRPEAEDPPLGEEPVRSGVSLAGLAGGAAPPSPLSELLTKAAPIHATARVEGDEIRATLRLAR